MLALAVLAACAHPIKTALPAHAQRADAQPATVRVLLARPVENLVVTVNRVAVVEQGFSQRVEVTDVPPGEVHLKVVGGAHGDAPLEKTLTLEVAPGQTYDVAIEAPEMTLGAWIYSATVYAAAASLYAVFLVSTDPFGGARR